MGKVSMEQIQPALDRIDEICKGLDNTWADRMIGGALKELKVHFIQRNIEKAYCTDLDFIVVNFEQDSAVPIAIVEIKKQGRPLKDWQKEIYLHIANSLDIPFYLLEVSDSLAQYWITDGKTDEKTGPLTMDQFDTWFRSIGDPTIQFYADDRDKLLSEVI